jgi:hypothetical protein
MPARVPAGPWETTAGNATTPDVGDNEFANREVAQFKIAGTLTAGAKPERWYAEQAWRIVEARASVGTAPTGATLIVDVNKNGTTIFTTQGDRPTIAISGFTDGNNLPQVTTLADGDYLSIDVDQIGSSVAGADLVVNVVLQDVAGD